MIDWKKTSAFCPTPSSNAIFVKKDKGSGLGVKEDDYLPFVLKLQSELLGIRDPANGQPIVVGADLNKLRGTSFVEPCPDITVRLRDGGFVSILKSSEIVTQRPTPDGTHRPAGIFIGHGPSFRKGARLDALNILDVSPLILTLLGIPVPSDMEGRVPTEALVGDHEVRKGKADFGAQGRRLRSTRAESGRARSAYEPAQDPGLYGLTADLRRSLATKSRPTVLVTAYTSVAF